MRWFRADALRFVNSGAKSVRGAERESASLGVTGASIHKGQSERVSGVLLGLALSEAIAVAFHFQIADMVCQSIQKGARQAL